MFLNIACIIDNLLRDLSWNTVPTILHIKFLYLLSMEKWTSEDGKWYILSLYFLTSNNIFFALFTNFSSLCQYNTTFLFSCPCDCMTWRGTANGICRLCNRIRSWTLCQIIFMNAFSLRTHLVGNYNKNANSMLISWLMIRSRLIMFLQWKSVPTHCIKSVHPRYFHIS